MKVPQFRDWLTHGSFRKPSGHGSQLPETLFWTSLQPSGIHSLKPKNILLYTFKESCKRLSSFHRQLLLSEGLPDPGQGSSRSLCLLIHELETGSISGATVRTEKGKVHGTPSTGAILAGSSSHSMVWTSIALHEACSQ